MNPLTSVLNNLASSTRNLHVSLPVSLAIGLSVADIWLPKYEVQLRKTERVLIAYGVIAAANSGPAQRKDKNETDDK